MGMKKLKRKEGKRNLHALFCSSTSSLVLCKGTVPTTARKKKRKKKERRIESHLLMFKAIIFSGVRIIGGMASAIQIWGRKKKKSRESLLATDICYDLDDPFFVAVAPEIRIPYLHISALPRQGEEKRREEGF